MLEDHIRTIHDLPSTIVSSVREEFRMKYNELETHVKEVHDCHHSSPVPHDQQHLEAGTQSLLPPSQAVWSPHTG